MVTKMVLLIQDGSALQCLRYVDGKRTDHAVIEDTGDLHIDDIRSAIEEFRTSGATNC